MIFHKMSPMTHQKLFVTKSLLKVKENLFHTPVFPLPVSAACVESADQHNIKNLLWCLVCKNELMIGL